MKSLKISIISISLLLILFSCSDNKYKELMHRNSELHAALKKIEFENNDLKKENEEYKDMFNNSLKEKENNVDKFSNELCADSFLLIDKKKGGSFPYGFTILIGYKEKVDYPATDLFPKETIEYFILTGGDVKLINQYKKLIENGNTVNILYENNVGIPINYKKSYTDALDAYLVSTKEKPVKLLCYFENGPLTGSDARGMINQVQFIKEIQ